MILIRHRAQAEARGGGANPGVYPSAAAEEVAQSASVLRDPWRLFPSLQVAFLLSFFLLTLSLLGNV